MSERYELHVKLEDGTEVDFQLQADRQKLAVDEANQFVALMKRRDWKILKAEVVTITETGVIGIPLD